jgi:single-strand DNA-binding protein
MLNNVVLIGRLTHDPELRYTTSGTAVASFTLAVERSRTNNGEKQTDFLPIIVWGKLGELCSQYLAKGRLAGIRGRIETRSYENREGQKVRVTEIVAEEVKFLDRGEKSEPAKPSTQPAASRYEDDPFADDTQFNLSDDDLPF